VTYSGTSVIGRLVRHDARASLFEVRQRSAFTLSVARSSLTIEGEPLRGRRAVTELIRTAVHNGPKPASMSSIAAVAIAAR
jgi:hypothetical protein